MLSLADSYIYVIVALLPLAASMVVVQANPYHALVVRGILGAVAALVYGILGAADVALTEALMGTMLAMTLYAIAVRSSLVMRLGVLKEESFETDKHSLIDDLRVVFNKHHLRLELVPYADRQDLHQALLNKEIHATCARSKNEQQPYRTETRIRRLYEIMQTELSTPATVLTYISVPESAEQQR